MRGRPPILTTTQLRMLREWRAKPRSERQSLRALADFLCISYSTAKRGANGTGYYTNTHRVSRGTDQPWQSHTGRKVCRPEALSVASSTGTPEITGVAGSAETRYHERRADPRGVAGNAGAAGRSSEAVS